jgi:hypothetical protein
MRKIPFSPPDLSQAEIDEVIKVLKSGWITTGPETKLFESRIAVDFQLFPLSDAFFCRYFFFVARPPLMCLSLLLVSRISLTCR